MAEYEYLDKSRYYRALADSYRECAETTPYTKKREKYLALMEENLDNANEAYKLFIRSKNK